MGKKKSHKNRGAIIDRVTYLQTASYGAILAITARAR
jgi:hypothetical protein